MVSYKDITSSGGTAIVPLSFQESVPKYDPSSFYNWEQDNIPLWVLQERGDTLWAQAGYPGGNPEGMTFVLSSTGSFDEAQGIYDNIDDITERIPKRLKFPVLIELCSYGALGTLDLANITCEGDGRLEVRNQTYFEDLNASAVSVGNYATSPVGPTPAIDGVRSLAGSSIMLGVSSTRSELVYGNQTSWNDNARIFCMQGPDTDRQANNLTVHIASGASLGTNNNQFAFAPYTSALDQTIYDGDAFPVFGSATAEDRDADNQPMIEKRDNTMTAGQSTTVGYGNWFSSVNIKDCQGTIIFRNILVDGSNQKADTQTPACIHETENGWNIENSDVIMDNNASIRNVETGFFIKNSRIKATGHWIAWRNYTKEGKTASDRKKDGKGVLAINSDLLWDTTYYTDSRKYLNWFGKSERGLETRNSTIRGGIYSNIVSSVPNAGSQCNGLDTVDAYGTSLLYCSGAGGDMKTSILNAADCNENGFHFEGSDVEFYGRLNGYLNQQNGLKALRSQVRLPQFTFNHNSKFGLNLEGSQLTYGWGIDEIVDEVGSADFVKVDGYPAAIYTQNAVGVDTPNLAKRIRNRAQFNVDSNNQNVLCDKSSAISPARMNLMNRYYGKWGGADWVATDAGNPYAIGGTGVFNMPATNFGATPYRTNNLPAMVITNNSDMELLNVNYAISSTDTGKGRVAIASNGSNVYFRGTSGSTTTMNYFPVNTNARQFRSWLTAGVAATDNSNVFMTGPTKSARFGINVLAENNSNFISTPPTIIGTDNALDVSGYELIDPAGGLNTSGNHTSLELHSTRSCVVINRNSNMRLYGLGGKVVSRADGTVAADSVDVLATGYADTFLGDQNNQWALSTSGGYVKFYPNAFVSGTDFDDGISLGNFNSQTFDAESRYLLDNRATNPYDRHDGGTTGGMCVRAVGGSNVDINLVNFQMYCQPGTLSGAFFNRSGSGCESIQGERGGYGGSNSETPPPPGPGVEYEQHPGAAAYDSGMIPVGGNESGGSTDDVRSRRETGLITDDSATNTVGSVTNAEGQGSMYNTVGVGNNNNSLMSNIEQPGSAEVIGDEYFGTAGTNNKGQAVQKTTNRFEMYMSANVGPISYDLLKDYACMGSPIHIWNIADTSRVQASNTLVNGIDPMTASIGTDSAGTDALNFHGPAGKWWNGVALDYFGLGGRRSTYGNLGNNFYNCGIYRLMFSTRGDLKGTYDCSTLSGTYTGNDGYYDNVLSGGGPVDQVNGCGYQYFTQDVRMLGTADMRGITGSNSDMPGGVYSMSSTLKVFGWGNPSKDPQAGTAQIQPRIAGFSAVNATSSNVTYDDAWMFSQAAPAFPLPPINMDWQGYMRNWFDETASNTWQNVKHLAEDKVNGVSIYRSHRGSLGGGEGREAGTGQPDGQVAYGAGVRSLNLFDFERLM
jgi:hypothetical protein